MNKKTFKVSLYLLCFVLPGIAMDQTIFTIPNSSYFVYENTNDDFSVETSNYIIFYSFDGTEIQRIENKFALYDVPQMLDPNAPKPQPTKCKIKYSNTGDVVPAYLIIFYDYNNNPIKRYRYDKKSKKIFFGSTVYRFNSKKPASIDSNFPLDLSNLRMIKTDTVKFLLPPKTATLFNKISLRKKKKHKN